MLSIALLLFKTIIWDSLTTAYLRNSGPQFCLLFYLQGCILPPCMLPSCFSYFAVTVRAILVNILFAAWNGESISKRVMQTIHNMLPNHRVHTHAHAHTHTHTQLSQWLFLAVEITAPTQKPMEALGQWSGFAERYAVSIGTPVADQL